MNCNITLIIILLLIIIIIGLIVFSQKRDKEITESFVASYNPLIASNQIASNNSRIVDLLKSLYNASPSFIQADYNTDDTKNLVEGNFASNVALVNSSMNNTLGVLKNYNNSKITQLENSLTDLENMTYNMHKELVGDKYYNTIKSFNNGLELNLVSTSNTKFRDEKTGSNIAAFMVNVNDGCLSIGANDYDIYQCNDKNPRQFFKMEHILNETAYQNAIDSALPFDNIDKSSINYPFVMMKSVNNENCLTNNHGYLTVQPCYSYMAQRWMAL
jgi:hypothetical protein